jgi:hypothetical protein
MCAIGGERSGPIFLVLKSTPIEAPVPATLAGDHANLGPDESSLCRFHPQVGCPALLPRYPAGGR